MARRAPQGLSTFPDGGIGCAERALFLAVIREALRDPDALEWLQSRDGKLVCSLAGIAPEYLTRKLVER